MKTLKSILLSMSIIAVGCNQPAGDPEIKIYDPEPEEYTFVREGTEPGAEEGTVISWGLTADGLLVISGDGAMKNYTTGVTDTENGEVALSDAPWFDLDITSLVVKGDISYIGGMAFGRMTHLKKVEIESGINKIGYAAFVSCPELTEIIIPEGITAIEYQAFQYCPALKSIEIPDSVETIGEMAFEGCTALENATFGTGLTYIAAQAFYGCSSLKSISLPDTLVTIGNEAFFSCAALENATLGSGLLYLGTGSTVGGVFESCPSLKSIVIPDGVAIITIAAFMNCTALASVTIGSGVTEIDANAFDGCTSLSSITIPSQVKLIRQYAFSHCSALADVTVMATTPPALLQDYSYISFDHAGDVLHVPAGCLSAYANAPDWNNVFSDIVEQ